MGQNSSFLARHEFLIRRLHSLSGLIPVGAFMCVHLLANASVLDSPATFQNVVFNIHKLGALLPLVEWTFIFIPILFHAILGVVIIRGGLPNNSTYTYANNIRYTLQRVTGMIAFVFIMCHVFHLHGWFHFDAWSENVAKPLGGYQFRAYNAASTAGAALAHPVIIGLYVIGVLSSVFHLANGLWTMGITWGIWVSPSAQRGANYACLAFGLFLAVVGLSAIGGFALLGNDEEGLKSAEQTEDRMYELQTKAGLIKQDDHKRAKHDEDSQQSLETAANDGVTR